MARLIFFESFASRHASPGARIDAHYAPLQAMLPSNRNVPLGFLTDERFRSPLESERYTQALYALAPRLLVLDAPNAGLWIADLLDPASLPKVAAARGLEPIAVFDGGRLALLRRRLSP